jgi:hypothetical protein
MQEIYSTRRGSMALYEKLTKKELVEFLNKCWMTHDGTWFLSCYLDQGIEKANKLNKSAIEWLAPMEIKRTKEIIGIEGEAIDTFQKLASFFEDASSLFIPDFMNASFTTARHNVIHWEFRKNDCFAYKGIKRLGAIEGYECGVIFRVQCWMDSLGISCEVTPKITRCLMLTDGECSGDFIFNFPE